MDRATRLAELWSWLPAFRTVAETQHLPTAAAVLHVSPSALSRSVGLLEAALGQPLFRRVGRRLQLDRAGELLLEATRDAMRRLDDGLDAVVAKRLDRVRVFAPAPWFELVVLPVMTGFDGVVLDVVDVHEPAAALLRGDIDLAVGTTPVHDDRLTTKQLGSAARAVCRARTTRRDAPFAMAGDDGWPTDRPRRIGLRAARLDAVIEACTGGNYLAILPVALARRRGLQITRTPEIAAVEVYTVFRTPITRSTLDPIIAAILARVAPGSR